VLALPELFTLSAVLERNPQTSGGKVQDRFGVTPSKIYRTLDEVLADPEIELVIVGTPNETHYEFAKAVLNAGKHGEFWPLVMHDSRMIDIELLSAR
jgi:predicted dehydrogenase